METIHLSNTVIQLIPERKLLHHMYEDADISGQRDAEDFAKWLDAYAPGDFIVVTTGDYIIPPCSIVGYADGHYYCQTYDARYCLYLVPVSVWEDCKEQVLAADAAWRQKQMECKRA